MTNAPIKLGHNYLLIFINMAIQHIYKDVLRVYQLKSDSRGETKEKRDDKYSMASASTLCCGTTSSIVSLDFSITSAHETVLEDGSGMYSFIVSAFQFTILPRTYSVCVYLQPSLYWVMDRYIRSLVSGIGFATSLAAQYKSVLCSSICCRQVDRPPHASFQG